MIRDNHITHDAFASPLRTWRFDSSILNAIAIAVLTTVLAYQATAIIFDLLLGIKPKQTVTAAHIHTLLLANESSPLSIAAAFFRRDILDRLRFRRDIPKSSTIARYASLSKLAVFKLLLLVITAPLLNLLAIAITLERDTILTCADAKFGGVALGIDPNLTRVTHLPHSHLCSRMAFNYDIADTPIAQFSLCVRVFLNITQQSGSFVTISSSQRGAIVVDIVISGNRYFIERRANMRTTNGVFRIANALTLEEADLLSFHAVLIIEEECGEDVTPDQVERAEVLETQSTFSVTRPVKCRALSTTQPFQPGSILGLIASLVTLNDAEELLVARVPQNPDLELDSPLKFSSGAHLNLLKRRQPTVSLAVLFIIVTCLVVIRIFVNLVTNNDVDAAIESILKSALGMHMSHSLLSDNSVVRYNHKYQQGDVAHYGVELQGMTEVAQFQGGVIGLRPEPKQVTLDKELSIFP